MKPTKLNVNQICSIEVYTNTICNHYVYKETKSILFGLIKLRDEGFYETGFYEAGDKYVTVDQIESVGRFVCRDKTVYYKPHVKIKMSNKNSHTMFFDTEDDLRAFLNSNIMKSVNWIDIK